MTKAWLSLSIVIFFSTLQPNKWLALALTCGWLASSLSLTKQNQICNTFSQTQTTNQLVIYRNGEAKFPQVKTPNFPCKSSQESPPSKDILSINISWLIIMTGELLSPGELTQWLSSIFFFSVELGTKSSYSTLT